MPSTAEVVSVLVAVEFVVVAAVVLLVVPLEAALPFVPLLTLFVVALALYVS